MNHHHTNRHHNNYSTRLRQADLAAALAIDHLAVTEVLNTDPAPADAAGARVRVWWQLTRWFGPRMPLPVMLAVEITHGMPWQAAAALEVLSELLRATETLTHHHAEHRREQKGPQHDRR